jgi:response regulator of citrate/malate metabolism
MHQVLALTDEKELMIQIEDSINSHSSIQILVSSDYLDLVENYQRRHALLVILDVDLLNGRVLQLINVLRAMKKDCRILLMLSPDKMSLCSRAVSQGMVSYLIKPICIQNARNIICSALDILLPKGSGQKKGQ